MRHDLSQARSAKSHAPRLERVCQELEERGKSCATSVEEAERLVPGNPALARSGGSIPCPGRAGSLCAREGRGFFGGVVPLPLNHRFFQCQTLLPRSRCCCHSPLHVRHTYHGPLSVAIPPVADTLTEPPTQAAERNARVEANMLKQSSPQCRCKSNCCIEGAS